MIRFSKGVIYHRRSPLHECHSVSMMYLVVYVFVIVTLYFFYRVESNDEHFKYFYLFCSPDKNTIDNRIVVVVNYCLLAVRFRLDDRIFML